MDQDELEQHISQIATRWTMVLQTHAGPGVAVSAAQECLLERYHPAIYRYLMGILRDRDAADELFQEFALRLVRGDFKRADPERGRFRNFLKTALYHLIVDYRRRQQKQSAPLAVDQADPSSEQSQLYDSDREFLAAWRSELMNRAWAALAQHDQQTGQYLGPVLRLRTDHPELRSPQMAENLAGVVGRPVTAEWIRKRLFLAREKFTDFLVQAVADSLENPTQEELEHELADLELIAYCRPALERRGKSST
jgi:RNA polymerase sigma-70 factor (ECF subfamily)